MNFEIRLLKKAYTNNKNLTHGYIVETVSTEKGFKTEYINSLQTDLRSGVGEYFEKVNLDTGERTLITNYEHSNLKDKILESKKPKTIRRRR